MRFLHRIFPVILLFILPVSLHAQKKVNLQGAWEKIALKINGKDAPLEGRQIKLLTATHYSWVKQDKKAAEALLAKGTLRDSLAAYHDEFGAGTYKISGDTYTETTEFFGEPQYIGKSVSFKFKIKNGLWYIKGTYTHFANGKKIDEELLEETWKRID
jgi:hypothetical protein